jgi:oligoribonuclease NrnB/cAMP/cGMP phosphodiesterase (DHH superfamily)
MNRLLISHTDLDGVGCRLVLNYLGIPYQSLMQINYDDIENNNLIPTLLKYDEILFTDFSPIKETLDILLENNKKVVVIDHHESSVWIKDVKHENLTCIHSIEKCGTALTYEYYKQPRTRYPRIMERFVHLVDTYDLYKTTHEDWEEAQNMNRVLWGSLSWKNKGFEQYTFITDFWLHKIKNQEDWSWSSFEQGKIETAIDIENKEYDSANSSLRFYTDENEQPYGVTVCPRKISIVASRLLTSHPEIKYIIIINTFDKTWEKLSIRSREDFNCTLIEGFDGHKQAAGGNFDAKYSYNLLLGKAQPKYKQNV